MLTRRSPFFYGWVIVPLAFLAALTAAGIRSTPSVLIHPFEMEFGWSRAEIAAAISVNLLLLGLGAPISGRLLDRFGPRKVVPVMLLVLCCAVLATTQMTDLWQLTVFWGILIGLAAGGGGVLATTVASRWFVARRGLVIGLLSTATSAGQIIFIPLLMVLAIGLGWRGASLVIALIALAVAVPVILFMRDDPAQVGQEPYGTGSAEQARQLAAEGPSVPLGGAVRTPEFWLLAGIFFTCGASANGLIGTHLIPHSIDHGVPEVTAAATVGVMGGMNVIGTLISGWLTDRYDPRKLLAFYFTFRGLSLFILPFVTGMPGLLLFAIPYGLDWFATVPPTATLTAKLFGRKSLGTIYGWIFFSHQVGASAAAFGSGLVRDSLGDYHMAFFAGGMLCFIGATLALFIRMRQQAPAPLAPASATAA